MKRRSFLTSLLGGLGAGLLPPPLRATPAKPERAPPVLLQESPLAGFQYHLGEVVWPKLSVGQTLRLVREPLNRHDKRAVAIYFDSVKLGYLPRQGNYTVAQMLDRGQALHAEIARLLVSTNPWDRVRVRIEA